MNILYILQQSIYDNKNKWKTADSNIQMMRGIINEIVEKKCDWNFYILIGKLVDFSDINSFDEIINHNRVHFIEYDFPVDAFMNRQNFEYKKFDSMFKGLPKIDIVWNNIIEISRNIKTYLFYKKINCKLISCNYWMDCPEINEEKVDKSISYDWRQFDGFECSDLCVFTCMSTREAFIKNSKLKFNNKYINKILNKSVIWDFGFSQNELLKFETNKLDKKTIVFLNRMSGINYTHHIEFINAINKLSEKRNDFQVIFTNPSGKIEWKWLKESVKNIFVIKEDTLTREEYIRLLWNSHISVHLYTLERYGGCCHREALFCNNIVVTPKLYEYEIIQGDDYPYYVKKDFSNLCEVISDALDDKRFFNEDILERNKKSSFEFISNNVVRNIEDILL